MNIQETHLDFYKKLNPLKIEDVTAIVIHHIEAEKASVAEIDSWHKQKGWQGIGYNDYIRKDGTVYICRGHREGAS